MLQQIKSCKRGHLKTPENLRGGHICRACDAAWREENKDEIKKKNKDYYHRTRESFKASSRNNRLKREYGIDTNWYEIQFASQGGVCAICYRPQERGIKSLAVDHDHVTGKVRGLLCRACNRGLGIFADDQSRLRSAIAYLEAHHVA